jgi:putative membrane protein
MKSNDVARKLFGVATGGLLVSVLSAAPAAFGQGGFPSIPDPSYPAQPNAGPQAGSVGNRTAPGVQQISSAAPPREFASAEGSDAATMRDKIFLRHAAQGGMAEVKLGELAAKKSTSDEVRKFGQKMVDDHAKLDAGLQPFEQDLGVPAPKHLSKQDQAEYDKLNAMQGDDFNREYLAYMRSDHHKDLEAFRAEIAGTNNADLKQAVAEGEKLIAQHTRLIDTLAAANSVPDPGK